MQSASQANAHPPDAKVAVALGAAPKPVESSGPRPNCLSLHVLRATNGAQDACHLSTWAWVPTSCAARQSTEQMPDEDFLQEVILPSTRPPPFCSTPSDLLASTSSACQKTMQHFSAAADASASDAK